MKPKLVIWVFLRALLLFIMLLGVFYLPLIDQPRLPDTFILTIAGTVFFLSGIAIFSTKF